MRTFLVDNGSLRPESWVNLCRVAEALTGRTRHKIEPASVLHSTRIEASRIPASWPRPMTWERATKAALEAGEREFLVLPLFFGPTGAITEYLPQRQKALVEKWGHFTVHFAPFLADELTEATLTLSDVLVQQVKNVAKARGLSRPPVILVDHGSPREAVTAVRNHLGASMRAALGSSVHSVRVASMERREGEAYAFNEPLLERALRDPGLPAGPVVLAMQFLSPGRHAGPGGDIDQICRAAEAERPGLRILPTDLVGFHPGLIDLLEARYHAALPVG